ncbi:hypothetical protein ACIQBJ_28480 [Kitasatospora sp. NPDC088391]|uniref:hypothetical protein n=1 Tax=Kitasatospora sp. NPDC088391 TaxID=3364074 RepID=UPI00382E955C
MALREHSRSTGRSGRHGRPGPFGGRLRLPTIRFSGAAMAMSTVVGISLATTWLLNEQQQIGRRPGVTVGGPPVPSPDPAPTGGGSVPDAGSARATADALTDEAAHETAPTPVATRTAARPAAATAPAPPVRVADTRPSPAADTPPTTAPTGPAPSPTGTPLAPSASPSSPAPSGSPRPGTPTAPALTMSGLTWVDALGRAGTRHNLRLRLDETMTALQVEFRLNRPDALPGTVPATDLPGAVATIALDRDTLVYRFTTPPDLPLPPGTYTFTVTGAIAAPSPTTPESWTASAFALPTSRAMAARGTF